VIASCPGTVSDISTLLDIRDIAVVNEYASFSSNRSAIVPVVAKPKVETFFLTELVVDPTITCASLLIHSIPSCTRMSPPLHDTRTSIVALSIEPPNSAVIALVAKTKIKARLLAIFGHPPLFLSVAMIQQSVYFQIWRNPCLACHSVTLMIKFLGLALLRSRGSSRQSVQEFHVGTDSISTSLDWAVPNMICVTSITASTSDARRVIAPVAIVAIVAAVAAVAAFCKCHIFVVAASCQQEYDQD